MSKTSIAIELKNVNFSYNNLDVFKDFNFQIEGDQLISLIGVNGSGKSTFLKLLLGLLSPRSGEVRLLGLHPRELKVRSQVGSALQEIDFPSNVRVGEMLDFVRAQFKDSHSKDSLIKDFSLEEFKNKSCSQLSGGMKRRLALACAFAGKPKIVLLDEPSTGLDVQSRKQLMTNLKKYQQEQKALVIMISHYPTEIIDSVDHFYLLKNGALEIISRERMSSLKQVSEITFTSEKPWSKVDEKKATIKGNHYRFLSTTPDQEIRDLCQQNFPFRNLRVNPLDSQSMIEEMF